MNLIRLNGSIVPVVNTTDADSGAVLFGQTENLEYAERNETFLVKKVVISAPDPQFPNRIFVSLKGEQNYGETIYTLDDVPIISAPKGTDTYTVLTDVSTNVDDVNTIDISKDGKYYSISTNGKHVRFVDYNTKRTKFLLHCQYYGISTSGVYANIPDEFFADVTRWELKDIKRYLGDWYNVHYQLQFNKDCNGDWCPRCTRWYPNGYHGSLQEQINGSFIDSKWIIYKIVKYLWNHTELIDDCVSMTHKELVNFKNFVLARS